MKKLACVLAVSSAMFAMESRADGLDDFINNLDEISKEDEKTDENISTVTSAEEDKGGKRDAAKPFDLLPRCKFLEGKAEVRLPGAKQSVPVEEGKRYPLGSSYCTIGKGSKLIVSFGFDSEVTLADDASFGTVVMPLGETKRAITLGSGTINVKMPNNLQPDMFTINSSGFVAYNPVGESRFTHTKTVDGDVTTVRCVTKTLSVKGRNFDIASMRAADEFKIRTSQDMLFTGIYGISGDALVRLDQGRIMVKDFGTGETKLEDKTLDWKLYPQSAVRIHRAKPALGENWSVTVMTFDASGDLKNRCAFAEKCVEVNSGELGPTSKKDREELAKRAAGITGSDKVEAVEEEVVVDEKPAAGKDEGGSTPAPAPADKEEDDLGF